VKFEIVEFQTIDRNFVSEIIWGWWSRVYEYPLVINKISQFFNTDLIEIHNTSWGFGPQHIIFKWLLEKKFKAIVNSDINHSNQPNTIIYDILRPPAPEFLEKFSIVLNISTIEELSPELQITAFKNLLAMTCKGGLIIATFDIPGINMESFESLFRMKFTVTSSPITGINSIFPDYRFKDLRCGYFVVKRIE